MILKIKAFIKKNFKIIFILLFPFLIFLFLDIIFPFSIKEAEKDYSKLYTDRNGKIMHISLSPTEKYRIKTSIKEMPDYLVNSFVAYEDKYFYLHPGFNPVSIIKAFYYNIISGKIVSGGSTITMQLVRMLKPRPRTYLSKLFEVFNALQLEFHYSKKEILEMYLNKVPMGGNIEGVGTASWFYFGKNISEISLKEALVLVSIPNNPNQNRPDSLNSRCKESYEKVIKKIKISETDLEFPSYILKKRYVNPYLCPHFLESKSYISTNWITRFSIDLNVQKFCENIIKKFSKKYSTLGINNGAIIVVDNKTMQVLAYIGSPDYFDDKNNGKVNGAKILRSPGSTLKPFIYAKAIDKGLITPKKIIYDIPKYYADDFVPYNFSKNTSGLVTVEYALQQSLNIPAIRLEEETKGLSELLAKIFSLSREKDIKKASLTIAIGGFYLTLEDLVELYASLANEGKYKKLKFTASEKVETGKEILSKEACYIISEMLSGYNRPDLPHSWEFNPRLAKLALKTGTSFGLKDAWCIGYNPDYTIGVWFGNVNGKWSPFLIGAEIASPVLVEVFNFLTRDMDRWFTKPEKVKKRKVCAVSGEKPNIFCSNTIEDYYIEGVSSEKECSVHKQIFVRKKDGKMVCAYCMKENEEYKKLIIENWPVEVFHYLISSGKKYTSLPSHNPDCPNYLSSHKPKIISPAKNSVFYFSQSQETNTKILLEAMGTPDTQFLYWFINDEFIKKAKILEKIPVVPKVGKNKISVFDEYGNGDSIWLEIK